MTNRTSLRTRHFGSRIALSLAACTGTVASTALAQSFNIDCGASPLGVPPATYGAAAAQPGFWNEISKARIAAPVPLLDLAGNSTTAQIAVSNQPAIHDLMDDSPGTSGPQEQLLDNLFEMFAPEIFTVSNLANGDYLVTTYAVDTGFPTFVSLVGVSGSQDGGQTVHGVITGEFELGLTHALHRVRVTNGTITIGVSDGLQSAALNGLQIRKLAAVETVCAGDGSVSACPCANDGAPGHGCGNSLFAGGALLGASGVASVGADTLVLNGSSMPDALCIYAQSTSLDPQPLLDGVNCMAGTIRRLGSKTNSGNASSHPGAGDPALSVLGAIPAAGGTYFYTAYYRNAAAFCTAATANYTNTIAVAWVP